MSNAAKSVYYFSFWVFASAIVLLLFPELLLDFMHIHHSASIIARIFGMVLLFLGFYYFMAGRQGDMKNFYWWTTYTRPTALLFALVFIISGQIKPFFLAFVIVDLLGAFWTWNALRQDQKVYKEI